MHVEQSVRFPLQELCRTNSADSVSGSAGRFVGDFYALADAREDHRVIAHHITAAQRSEANRAVFALTGVPFAGIHGAVGELCALRFGDDFAEFERSAGRRIDLHAVMHFKDFDVVALIERSGRKFEQLKTVFTPTE